MCSIDEEARVWIRGFLLRVWSVMFLMWARRGGACGIGIAVSPFFCICCLVSFVSVVDEVGVEGREVWLIGG